MYDKAAAHCITLATSDCWPRQQLFQQLWLTNSILQQTVNVVGCVLMNACLQLHERCREHWTVLIQLQRWIQLSGFYLLSHTLGYICQSIPFCHLSLSLSHTHAHLHMFSVAVYLPVWPPVCMSGSFPSILITWLRHHTTQIASSELSAVKKWLTSQYRSAIISLQHLTWCFLSISSSPLHWLSARTYHATSSHDVVRHGTGLTMHHLNIPTCHSVTTLLWW